MAIVGRPDATQRTYFCKTSDSGCFHEELHPGPIALFLFLTRGPLTYADIVPPLPLKYTFDHDLTASLRMVQSFMNRFAP